MAMNGLRVDSALELVGDKGMAKIVDLDVFDVGFFEVSVDGGANISDKQRSAGLGDKQVGVGDLGAQGQIIMQGGGSGAGKGNSAGGVVF